MSLLEVFSKFYKMFGIDKTLGNVNVFSDMSKIYKIPRKYMPSSAHTFVFQLYWQDKETIGFLTPLSLDWMGQHELNFKLISEMHIGVE